MEELGIPENELRELVTQKVFAFEQATKGAKKVGKETLALSFGSSSGLRGGGNAKYLDAADVRQLLDGGSLTFYEGNHFQEKIPALRKKFLL